MGTKKTTFCRICEPLCGLTVEVEDNRIIDIKPDKDHLVSKGFACLKGLSFEKFRTSPDRLTHPLKKVNGEYQQISWDQALTEIGDKVKQLRKDHGDESIGLYFGNPVSFSPLLPLIIMGFIRGLNTTKFFNPGSLDVNNKFAVNERMYGTGMSLTFPDVDRTQFLMIIGSNPTISKMSMIHLPYPTERIKDIIKRGGQVVHVNPRLTETVRETGCDQVFIRPDTDAYFLAAFLHEVIARDAVKHERVSAYMSGYEQLKAVVAEWTPEKQAQVTGISAEKLRELVTAYLAADGSALYASTGLNLGRNGTVGFWFLEAINAITGNLDRLGGTLMGKGIIDYQKLMADHPSSTKYSRIGNFPSCCEGLPTSLLADEIQTPGQGQIRGMFVISGNPVLMSTNSQHLGKALDSLELMVSVEIVRNETANYADYILPGTHFAERPDIPISFTSLIGLTPVPYYQYTDRLVDPPGECRDESWIICQLCKHCDAPFYGSRALQVLLDGCERMKKIPIIGKRLMPMPERLLDLLSRYGKQGSLKKLRQSPHGVLLEPWQSNNYLGKRVLTASKKVELAPAELVELANTRLHKLFAEELKLGDKIKLISKRERFSHNAWTHNEKVFIRGDRNTNYLYIHPSDASRLSIAESQMVRISNDVGSVEAPAAITEDMMPGTVALPQGWGHQDSDGLTVARETKGVNSNILASDSPDRIEPISGIAHFNGIVVNVSPVLMEHYAGNSEALRA